MPAQMYEKFLDVPCHGVAFGAKFPRDYIGDLGFCKSRLKKFQRPRADQVQPEHLPVADIEDNRTVLIVRGTRVFRQLYCRKLRFANQSV
jgi:hypothetical protein